MQKRLLGVCVLVLGSSLVASATPLAPGMSVPASVLNFDTNPSDQKGFYNSTITVGDSVWNYTVAAIADSQNTLCAGCFTFVYQLGNFPFNGNTGFPELVVGSFFGWNTSVGYSGTLGQAPTTISRSSDGSLIDFLFSPPIPALSDGSLDLVVETNSRDFSFGGTLGDQSGVAGSHLSLEPVPEPTSFVLLGSGLLGLAATAKRKLLA